MDDRELLEALRTRPEDGLWLLTQQYGGLIDAVVRRILPGDAEDAEECAADVLVRIWRAAEKLELQEGTLRGYVIWCARNTAIDRYRRLKRQRQRTADGGDELLLVEHWTERGAQERHTTHPNMAALGKIKASCVQDVTLDKFDL